MSGKQSTLARAGNLVGILVGVGFLGCLGLIALLFSPALPGIDGAYSPAWSPDGEHIAFECIFYSYPEVMDMLMDDWVRVNYYDRDICITSGLDGQGTLRLTQTHEKFLPSWSADGHSLAWLESDRTIAIFNMDTQEITRYLSDERFGDSCFSATDFGCELTWSRDGKNIIVQGDGRILDLLSGSFISLPVSDHSERVWSSDRRFLAFTKLQNEDLQGPFRFRMYISENDQTIGVAELEVTYYNRFSWSPDNRVLGWVGTQDPPYDDRDQLVFTNAETGETSIPNLVGDIRTIDNPVWSPDGTRIAFVSAYDICVLELEIRSSPFSVAVEKMTIIQTPSIDFAATVAWSSDGQHLAYQTSDGELRIVDINGKRDRRIQ